MTDGATEASVERLDRMRRVDDLAELERKLVKRNELVPDGSPRLNHCRTHLLPIVCELGEARLSSFDCRGGVDLAHRGGDPLPVLARGIAEAVSDHAHDHFQGVTSCLDLDGGVSYLDNIKMVGTVVRPLMPRS